MLKMLRNAHPAYDSYLESRLRIVSRAARLSINKHLGLFDCSFRESESLCGEFSLSSTNFRSLELNRENFKEKIGKEKNIK